MKHPESESIRLAMDQAWRDHHHARDQTWKAVQMEAVLGAGLVSVDAQYQNLTATGIFAALVFFATLFGIWISLHHRKLEIRKFEHILNCEKALGLHRDDLISKKSAKLPSELRFYQAFSPFVQNTAAFILRIHVAIMLFAVLLVVARWLW